ncbi:MAG: hypothetical protein ACW99G_02790 [Candidatus Thorarchaeota archaeon]|jgi:hypothetical protein
MKKIIYPPHPATNMRITSHRLPAYEETQQYVAQLKFNGHHIVVCITADRKVYTLTRHGTETKGFNLEQKHIDEFLSLDLEDGKEYWFAGELFHTRTKSAGYNKESGGNIVLFDLLQDGKYLFRVDQMTRLKKLEKICRHPKELEPYQGVALKVTDHIWLAELFESNFAGHWKKLIHIPEVEGLVLRKKKSVLNQRGSKKYDVNWMIRVRKPDPGGSYQY